MTDPVVYKVAQVAAMLQTSQRIVIDCIKAGEIPGFKLGSQWRIPKSWVDELQQQSGDLSSVEPT